MSGNLLSSSTWIFDFVSNPLFYFITIIEELHLEIQIEISVLFHEGCVYVQPSTLSQIFIGI